MAIYAIDPLFRAPLSPRRAAAIVALAWLPVLLIAASLPRFVSLFDRWNEDLPPLTHALVNIGRLGYGPIVLAEVGLLTALSVGCATLASARLPSHRPVVMTVAVFGILMFPVLFWGVMGPMLTLPPVSHW